MAEDNKGAAIFTRDAPASERVEQDSPATYLKATELKPGEFEIGLVLGGTVSVGSYTAGVLDFLFEALDAWEAERIKEDLENPEMRTVPRHRVRIKVITGTSGGGICALLAARALHYDFRLPKSNLNDNPFYSVWVNDIDITKLLNCSDLEGSPPPEIQSLMNGHVLKTIAEKALQFPSTAQFNGERVGNNVGRPYVANPLQLVVTHTNLRGIPYKQTYTAGAVNAEYFTNHVDYVRIAVDFPGLASPAPMPALMPDALSVFVPAPPARDLPGFDKGPLESAGNAATLWANLAQYALGTSAFPIGLPARTVNRDATHYRYRYAWDSANGSFSWLIPEWTRFVSPDSAAGRAAYNFTSLDGGCTDNEPIQLAKHVLEGLEATIGGQGARPLAAMPGEASTGVPPHAAADANRAVILVDPLCEIPPNASASPALALFGLLGPTVHMLVYANRFATSDIADFLHPQIYNRFLVAPKRTDPSAPTGFRVGGDALAGEGLGAFLGFMHKDYRHHDFMLGRFNCQAFLSGTFTLKSSNPVFLSPKPELPPAPYKGEPPTPGELPVIPLYGSAASSMRQPPYPTPGKYDPKHLQRPVQERAQLLLQRAIDVFPMKWYEKLVYPFARRWLAGKMAEKFVEIVTQEVKRKGL